MPLADMLAPPCSLACFSDCIEPSSGRNAPVVEMHGCQGCMSGHACQVDKGACRRR